jgi:maltose alpha-D-glucosyltransferase/alpha-amylase
VRPYFGAGDEFHMAFHFPLMPRLFMGLHSADRRPITDVFLHTPAIPDTCQWCLFLRNHDELTLEMCTGPERDYMYYAYAQDPLMKLNIGIRRRLAPLIDNHRGKLELLHGLLFSLPGTPVIYYGDEIGMGDNIHLGDRNGVRTPMQWSADTNAGFSRADPAKLYGPVIADPVYGYQTINVEAQQASASSLLNAMRRLIAVRKTTRVFGRGTLRFLSPANTRVLAYVRESADEHVLVVANLAASAEPVELDLRPWGGAAVIEMLGGSRFPPVGDHPYFLSLAPWGFYWLRLMAPHGAARIAYGIEGTVV